MAEDGKSLEGLSGIDYAEAMERFAGNESLYQRLAIKFLDDPHYEALKRALDKSDTEQAHQEARSLKGIAGNLSFSPLYQIASLISDALRAGDTQTALDHSAELDEAYTAVIASLRSIKE